MSGIHSLSTVNIARTPLEIWEFVIEPENERFWHTDVTEGAVLSKRPLAVGSRVRWVMNFGQPRPVTLRVVSFEVPSLYELRAEHAVMGLTPTLTYELTSEAHSTVFARTIDMNPAGIARAATPVMRRNVIKNNERFVRNLKEHLERRPELHTRGRL